MEHRKIATWNVRTLTQVRLVESHLADALIKGGAEVTAFQGGQRMDTLINEHAPTEYMNESIKNVFRPTIGVHSIHMKYPTTTGNGQLIIRQPSCGEHLFPE